MHPQAPAPTHRERIGTPLIDCRPGANLTINARRTVTDFDNVTACVLAMNTHPTHTDYAYAEATQFGKPLVVSPLLLSMLVAFVTNELFDAPIAGFEIRDLTFDKAVHPGDTVTAKARFEEVSAQHLLIAVTGLRATGETFARFRLELKLRAGTP